MDVDPPATPAEAVIAVPEIRDYHAINAAIVRHLDDGRRTIRLSGVHGQRLLAAGLSGPWDATIEIDGDAGPELAAGLDAPLVTVVCRGRADDGGASQLKAGCVFVLGDVGTAFGYAMSGGMAATSGDAGARAGLRQSGGELFLLGNVGPMVGELQSGGCLFVNHRRIVPHASHGRSGGFLLWIDQSRADAMRRVLMKGAESDGPGLLDGKGGEPSP